MPGHQAGSAIRAGAISIQRSLTQKRSNDWRAQTSEVLPLDAAQDFAVMERSLACAAQA
jgi:hypothetical protein